MDSTVFVHTMFHFFCSAQVFLFETITKTKFTQRTIEAESETGQKAHTEKRGKTERDR